MYDGWWHRRLLWWTIVPAVLLQLPELWQALRQQRRWLFPLAALLTFQMVSRWWSSPADAPTATLGDTAALVLLLGATAYAASQLPRFPVVFSPTLVLVSAVVTLWSLGDFYSSHSLAQDRFRNVLVYKTGLNPVLTGLLCSFAALQASALALTATSRQRRFLWLGLLTLHVFALLATQSRTALVALVVGMAVLAMCERKRLAPSLGAAGAGAAAYAFLLVLLPAGGEAASDFLARGSTGRLQIYRWFLTDMQGLDFVVGKGMSHRAVIAEAVLGWRVAHPHNSYLTQFYLTGVLGLALLLTVLAMAGRRALALARNGQPLWLALLAGHGAALLVDGAQIFSLASIPRIEVLLLAVPVVIASSLPNRQDVPSPGNPERAPSPDS